MESTLIKKLTDIEQSIMLIKKQIKDGAIEKERMMDLYNLISKIHNLTCGGEEE